MLALTDHFPYSYVIHILANYSFWRRKYLLTTRNSMQYMEKDECPE